MAGQDHNFLKLHLEEEVDAAPGPSSLYPGQDELQARFERVSGWTLGLQASATLPGAPRSGKGPEGPKGGRFYIDDMSTDLPPGQAAVHRERCEELVDSINAMAAELDRTRIELWRREAELAAGIPVVPHSREQPHLAERLSSIMRAACDSTGSTSAALYVLDDSTSELKLRSCWNLPADRFLEPPRPLRGRVADLEALIGNAVVLEDTRLLPHWQAPEEYPSAVCVPVSTPTTPLGTLWVFSDKLRDYNDVQTEILEIIAGRVAAELEREAILRHGVGRRENDRQMALATSWQAARLPNVQPIIDNLQIGGWTEQSDEVGGDFHDWTVLNDSRLATAVGDAQGACVEAALTAASIQSGLRAIAANRHTPLQLLSQLNETMWTGGLGDQFASLYYGILDPQTWKLEFALAGNMLAFHCDPSNVEVFDEDGPMLGVEPDIDFRAANCVLTPGSRFIVMSDGLRHALWRRGVAEDVNELSQFLQRHLRSNSQELIDLIKQASARRGEEGVQFDRALLVLDHQPRSLPQNLTTLKNRLD